MADGRVKPIEQVQVGDLVLAKDESSGEVSAKKVTQTFQRTAPSTWVLFFAREVIETTAEHPFYVEHKGFVPAGLLAIGNSIVTRAGPALQVLGKTEKKQATQVYNFSVQDNHTYFVGRSGLWVHNVDCEALTRLHAAAKSKADELLDVAEANRPSTACSIDVPGHPSAQGHSSFLEETAEQWWARMDPRVKDLYDQVKRDMGDQAPGWHGYCAEVDALSDLYRRGIDPRGAKGLSVMVGNDARRARKGKHGHLQPACKSCAEVFRRLGITDDYTDAVKVIGQ